MNNGSTVISYTLAALAGVCFVQGLALLTSGGGDSDHGKNKKICVHS
jgi:hypothetical protein